MAEKDKAQEVMEFLSRSRDWLESNYWDQFEQVMKNFMCESDAHEDPNDATPNDGRLYDAYNHPVSSKKDLSRTAVGMPDTFAMVRRSTARYTAQIPNIRFRCDDTDRAERVSRDLMYQWDKGGNQRYQKKHVAQGQMFGWSVKAWYWDHGVMPRFKRVDPFDPSLNGDERSAIAKMYGEDIRQYAQESMQEFGGVDPSIINARLMEDHSRGNLLPIRYTHQGFAGPRSEVLFIGDCFPEPNFVSIQSSNWFIVQRRRNKRWLLDLAKMYKDEVPEIKENVENLLRDKPHGMPKRSGSRDTDALFRRMQGALDRSTDKGDVAKSKADAEWVITECHYPGDNPRISYSCEKEWLGEVPYPYELNGEIAFTELIFIDDMLGGIGVSNARVMRGLQGIHNKLANSRSDLVDAILRPLVYTTNENLWENPELIKRHGGMRLVKLDHPSELGTIGEQSALAAVSTGLNDESSIMRNFQLGTGESNMSMSANVDPSQNRTATGARIMAYNQDVLTKDALDMLNESVRADAWMMFYLNRSEKAAPQRFDSAPYNRSQRATDEVQQQNTVMEVTPRDFQDDGEIEPEVGSTLADDDESRTHRAQNLWQFAMSNPQIVNVRKAAESFLTSMGESRHLGEWILPEQPPPPPPPPKLSGSVPIKFEILDPSIQTQLLAAFGLQAPQVQPESNDPMNPNPNPPIVADAPQAPTGAGAMAAASGDNPLEGMV